MALEYYGVTVALLEDTYLRATHGTADATAAQQAIDEAAADVWDALSRSGISPPDITMADFPGDYVKMQRFLLMGAAVRYLIMVTGSSEGLGEAGTQYADGLNDLINTPNILEIYRFQGRQMANSHTTDGSISAAQLAAIDQQRCVQPNDPRYRL